MDQVELYYSIVSQFWVIGENTIEAVVFAGLCRRFSGQKRRVWMAGVVYWAMMLLLYYLPWEFGFFGACSLSLTAAFGLWSCLEKGEASGRIYLTVTFGTLNWICSVIASNCYLMVSDVFQYFVYCSTENSERPWQFFFAAFNVTEILHFLILSLLLFGSASFMKKCLLQKRCSWNKKELCILLIPSVLGISNHMIRRVYSRKVEAQLLTTETDWDLRLLWCVNDLILIAAILLVLLLLELHKQQLEFQQNRHMLQEQVEDMQSHIRSVERIYAGIRGLKHDLGNHAQVLQGLLEQGEYGQARAYAGTLAETAGRFQYEISTGNPVTDVILNEKSREAGEQGISFQVDFRYPGTNSLHHPNLQPEGIDAFDISILLKNGLENAFAAAATAREPFVSVCTGQKKHTWMLTIVNTFSGELQWEEDGLPKTTKEPKELHGYGLKNIRSVAEQYCGGMELTEKETGKSGDYQEKQMVLTVMLQLP